MDEITTIVNKNKNYQIFITIISIFINMICIVFTLQSPFFLKYPNFYVMENQKNITNNTFILKEYSESLCDKSKYIIKKDPQTSLHNWAYTFDLYCERDIYGLFMVNAIFIGGIIGNILLAHIPDKYGREKIFKILVLSSFILHINILFSIGPIHLIIVLFLIGIHLFLSSLFVTIVSEFLEDKYKGTSIGLGNSGYSLGGVFFGFFFLFINEWRIYYVIASLILAFMTYYTFKYLYETPRWLHSKRQKEKCIETLTKIAKYNNLEKEWIMFQENNPEIINLIGSNTKLNETKESNLNDLNNQTKDKNYTMIDIIFLKSQRKNFILSMILCFTTSYTYFGIVLTLDGMKGNFFSNTILSFVGELISESTSGYLSDYLGRKKSSFWTGFIGILSFISYLIFTKKLSSIFLMIAMMGFAGNYVIEELYIAELFPTQIRGNIMALASIIMRIAPLFVTFFRRALGSYIDISFILSGILNLGIIISMTETLGQSQKDFVEEDEYYNSNNVNLKTGFLENNK